MVSRPKRYYKRLARFPDNIDLLEAEVGFSADGTPVVTEAQIARWVEDLFLGGGMKAVVGYIILKYGAWEQAMDLAHRQSDPCCRKAVEASCDEDDVRSRAEQTAQSRGGSRENARHGSRESAKDAPLSPQKHGFRAAWALEWAYEQAEERDIPEWFFDRLVDDFCASTNGSLHRIYAKMICDRMRFGNMCPTDAQAERLAERCFDLVIDPQTKTALKFWCLEILAELAPRIDWVAAELTDTLRHISEAPDCSPGMKVATREILKRLSNVQSL